jgi:hypothetical protein
MLLKKINLFLIGIMVISSCATFKKQIKNTSNVSEPQSKEIAHTLYLIGDAGNAVIDSSTTALKSLKKRLRTADSNATVLFLGDNVYPKGLPSKDSKSRDLAEYRLKIQIKSVKKFKGETIFIPGNHDWYSDGVKGLKRQQNYVEKRLGKNSFLPKDGCPIKTVNISDDIVLIIVDSHWYITNWDRHPTINDNCDLKTRDLFLDEFRSEIKKARGKTTLVALHHPMFSNGSHGGQYSFINHLKPLPVLGTLKNILRETSGIANVDLSNQYYNELKQNIVAVSQQNEKVIFISGHDHSLQYIVEDNIPQIISGSGSKATAARNVKGGQFAYAEKGYAILDIYTNGSSHVRFITAKEDLVEFQTQVLKPDADHIQTDFPILTQDSIQASILTIEETTRNNTYKFLWGERFRENYSIPVMAKVVYLDTLLGGLTPIRMGGGKQSKTLHLRAADGKRYVVRAMKKQAAQYIQEGLFQDQYVEGQFDSTFTEDLVNDAFTGSYPYAPFIIGTLCNEIDLPHLNPHLYYVPKQKALGKYNEIFGNELCMIEEHPSEGHDEFASDNFTGNILSTQDMMTEIHKKESELIDESAYIKARLFDMLIGDWDRHQDQWRWLEFNENGNKIYRPLPRDRDQPFSRWSDGFMLSTALALMPAARLLRSYSEDVKDVKSFNTNPYSIDKAFMTNSDKSVWDAQVKFIQSNITDELIDQAFKNVPKEVNQETIAEIKATLKVRRSNLQKISGRYYELLNKYAVITASNKDDFIKVKINEKGEVLVRILRKKDKTLKDEFYNRTYYPKHTKEIWIYGLDDEDTFEVTGKSSKIKIRLIGGQNNDKYIVENGKNIVIYDYRSKHNDLTEAKKATRKLQDSYDVNVYDYKKSKSNLNALIPIIGGNPDDGLKLGVSNTYTVYGFERNPFTVRHHIEGSFYFATQGFDLQYKGEFANVIGKTNLLIESIFTSPNFSINFFGYGNETVNDQDEFGMDYNRVKVEAFNVKPSLVWKSFGGSYVSAGISYIDIEVAETKNRFVTDTKELPNYIFDENQFAGIHTKFEYENYDNEAYPTNGMATSIEFGYKLNLKESDRDFTYLIPEIGFVHKINTSGRLVFATKFKGHLNFNPNYEFYQAATIGGSDGLRGFRNQRFTGQKSYYQSTDIRYSFKKTKTRLLPIRLGLYGGFDYGRVWLNQESSNKWHYSYGGGLFINGADLISANLGVFNSVEGLRVVFKIGFGL